ncbi:proteasome, subunit alpha/beta, partial [Kipferlia bialata]
YKWGHEMACDTLARRMGDLAQVYTQKAWMRPFGVSLALFQVDPEKGPLLYRTDPAGYCVGFKAVAAGEKGAEVSAAVEKELKKWGKGESKPVEDCLQTGLKVMQTVLGNFIKGKDLEVLVARAGDKGSTSLERVEEERVDALLTEVAEAE